MTSLCGKVAVITGAGSGIGRATGELFARAGARVAVVDVSPERAQHTARAIDEAGGQSVAIAADVSDADGVVRMVYETMQTWGRIDVLHNNAGMSMRETPIDQVDDDFFDRMLAVNVRSVYLGAKHVVPHMKRQGGGVIVNTASTAGIRPRAGATAYAASKGAVIALTKALAIELAPFRIRVVSINPFATDTPMLHALLDDDDPERARQARLAAIPLGRLIQAEDVAQAALFLASDAAAMVTGVTLAVDGGRLLG